MAQNSTKINSLQSNCSESALNVANSIAQNVTQLPNNLNDQFMGDKESQRIITESHENSWQTALLYISIILSVYLITIMFIGVRYALNRYYDKTFDLCCSQCCQYCSTSQMNCSCFSSTSRRRNDYFTSSSPSSSQRPNSQLKNYNSAAYLSPDDLNTIEVTQTDEGLLETDL